MSARYSNQAGAANRAGDVFSHPEGNDLVGGHAAAERSSPKNDLGRGDAALGKHVEGRLGITIEPVLGGLAADRAAVAAVLHHPASRQARTDDKDESRR